jgi:hypothetical protein
MVVHQMRARGLRYEWRTTDDAGTMREVKEGSGERGDQMLPARWSVNDALALSTNLHDMC